MSTPSDRLRQSDRISLRMPVEVAWATAQGATFSQTVETLLVSRNGGVLRFTEKLEDGQELHLRRDWKSTRLNSSHVAISYAVFCLKKKKRTSAARLYGMSTNQR